ncbi:hypothetical protein AB0I60_23435 [Actinosynnema sp. NPDC050436]|uniref:hypothetical protein n=1 Tax=Actinosynnema sp. NPDC050436 TaxID=3155659 RepID=UPI003408E368
MTAMRRGLLVAAVGTGPPGRPGRSRRCGRSRCRRCSSATPTPPTTASPPCTRADDIETLFCFRAEENHPAVVARQPDRQGVALDIASDRSCGGAPAEHFWTARTLLDGVPARPPQQEALGTETRLAVGSLGGNTVGLVDGDQPAGQCAEYSPPALKPLANVPADALPVFDAIEQRLNDVMRTRATEAGRGSSTCTR